MSFGRDRIRRMLIEEGPMTARELVDRLGHRDRRAVVRMLRSLHRDGLAHESEAGVWDAFPRPLCDVVSALDTLIGWYRGLGTEDAQSIALFLGHERDRWKGVLAAAKEAEARASLSGNGGGK